MSVTYVYASSSPLETDINNYFHGYKVGSDVIEYSVGGKFCCINFACCTKCIQLTSIYLLLSTGLHVDGAEF